MSETENLTERGTHGGPKMQRKISGKVQRTTEDEVHPGRAVRRARKKLEGRKAAFDAGSGVKMPGSLKCH